jgi:hypothetical protein
MLLDTFYWCLIPQWWYLLMLGHKIQATLTKAASPHCTSMSILPNIYHSESVGANVRPFVWHSYGMVHIVIKIFFLRQVTLWCWTGQKHVTCEKQLHVSAGKIFVLKPRWYLNPDKYSRPRNCLIWVLHVLKLKSIFYKVWKVRPQTQGLLATWSS